ncbi:MAG: hypothetical protein ACYTEP_03045 [Planctomycetota bacterium]|jgi:hypothetical protein
MGSKKTPCTACEGDGRLLVDCETCAALGFRVCLGCDQGSFRSWEVIAEALGDAGNGKAGLLYLEAASSRCTETYQARRSKLDKLLGVDGPSGAEERREELERQFQLDKKRFASLEAALQMQVGDGE